MGPDGSIPKLDPNQRNIHVINKKMKIIPYKIQPGAKLVHVNLSGNLIRSLPLRLNRLTKLILSNNELSTFPEEMIESLLSYGSLEYLDLSQNYLYELDSRILKLKSLKTLNMYSNKMLKADCISSSLENVDFCLNNFSKMPIFGQNIVNLSIEANKITVVSGNLPMLISLNMSHNIIEYISGDSLYKNLRSLDLSYNMISCLPDFRKITPKLRRLDLSHNNIEKIPDLPRSLSVLLMADNSIKKLSSDFSQLPYLVILDFSQNMIESIPLLPMSIQTIDFSSNRITNVIHSETPDLIEMRISNNQMESLPIFSSNLLKEININSNMIKKMNLSVLNPEITVIELYNNQIEEIPDELFSLPELITLNLSRNCIRSIPSKIIESNIINLYLSENPLCDLPELPVSIENLYISSCNFREIPSTISSLSDLYVFSCSGNNIETLPAIQNCCYLNISNNKFREIPELPSTVQFLDASFNYISEFYPISPSINELNLSYNKLLSFPIETKTASIISLNICGNLSLEGQIDLSTFPKLKILNISQTKISIVGNIRRLIHFITSKDSSNNENTTLLDCGSNSTYLSIKGKDSMCEDIPFAQIYPEFQTSIFSLIQAHDSFYTGCKTIRHLLKEVEHHMADFDGDVLYGISSSLSMIVDNTKTHKESNITIAVIRNSILSVSQNGFYRVAIVSENGDVQFTTANSKRQAEERVPFVPRNPLSHLKSYGRRIVFGVVEPFRTESLLIKEEDRFMIIASEKVFNFIPPSRLGSMAHKAKSSKELAIDLRNISHDYLVKTNTSVFVIGLHEESHQMKRSMK